MDDNIHNLQDALEWLDRSIREEAELNDEMSNEHAIQLGFIQNMLTKFPRRNCDRFSTLYDAVVTWGREDQNWDDWPDEDAEDENDLLNILTGDQIHELVDWLLAPATKQKGEKEKPMENKNNFATMHSALTSAYMVLIKAYQDNCQIPPAELARVISVLEQAVALKPRNCDEGTEQEQQDRFREFCRYYESKGECGIGRYEAACPAFQGGRNPDCSLWWAQMPYKKGDNQ